MASIVQNIWAVGVISIIIYKISNYLIIKNSTYDDTYNPSTSRYQAQIEQERELKEREERRAIWEIEYEKRKKEHNVSKSDNPSVKILYNDILENQFSDSDYWSISGCNYLVHILSKEFRTLEDWNALNDDLENWSNDQIEIFFQSMIEGQINYCTIVDNILEQRLRLISTMLRIVTNRKKTPLEDYVTIYLYSNNDVFDDIPIEMIHHLDKIAEHLGYSKHINTDNPISVKEFIMKRLRCEI